MTYRAIEYSVTGGVALITLSRPEAANALDCELARDLFEASLSCGADPDVRAIVITGAGRMFCAGGDLKSFQRAGSGVRAHILELTTYLHGAISRLVRGDAPLIAAVNGAAAGAGLSIACACDIIVAAKSARFTLAYTRAGLTPDGSSTYFLPRRIGLGRAAELALTNRTLSAQEAADWGLANRVVADAELLPVATELATELAEGPTAALGEARRLLHGGLTQTLETQMELEAQAIAEAAESAEGREGVAAFLEKRVPSFRTDPDEA